MVNVLFDKEIPAEIADDVAECRGLWLDAIAETDDDLMMRYLDGEELSDEEIRTGLRKSIKTGRTIPVFAGSSVKDIGITELMDAIVELFPTPLNYVTVDGAKRKIADDTDAIGVVFKSINDPFVGQLTFVRTVSGVFRADSDIYNLSRPGGQGAFRHALLHERQESGQHHGGRAGIDLCNCQAQGHPYRRHCFEQSGRTCPPGNRLP
ncbi:MAG: hypothetical protein L6W00_23955 [Lentisphaeria bacterium]|nr:MAG: hypothetical protein L6W00_23955 [Lentisphaeria bacterium]